MLTGGDRPRLSTERNETGLYRLDAVDPGIYDLEATRTGFRMFVATGIGMEANRATGGHSGRPILLRRGLMRGSSRMNPNSGKASARPTRKGPRTAIRSIASSVRPLSLRPA
jgi:hypothetical protein